MDSLALIFFVIATLSAQWGAQGCISHQIRRLQSKTSDRGEMDIIKASEALVSGSIPDGRTKFNLATLRGGVFVSGKAS